MPREEKLKFEFEEKKFSLLLQREVCGRFWLENTMFSNKLNFFSSNSNFDFFREATKNDHILLHKFENDQKKIGCVGCCGYGPASVNCSFIVVVL